MLVRAYDGCFQCEEATERTAVCKEADVFDVVGIRLLHGSRGALIRKPNSLNSSGKVNNSALVEEGEETADQGG